MAVAQQSRRQKRKAAAREKKEPSYVLIAAPLAPGQEQPPPPPVLLSPDLLHSRERMFAIAASVRFRGWLLEMMALRGITMDHWPFPDAHSLLHASGHTQVKLSMANRTVVAVELLTIFIEANLLLRVKWPAYPTIDVEDEAAEEWTPRDEGEAAAVGLSIRHPRRGERRPEPELPGCQGHAGKCKGLRRYGERFCPTCRRAELTKMRAS